MPNPKTHAWHVTEANRYISDAFASLAHHLHLTHSKALERAVIEWLRVSGVPLFADPAPGRMQWVRPISPGDFEPYEEWAEVAPYMDRWQSPPRVVLEGTDGMEPTE